MTSPRLNGEPAGEVNPDAPEPDPHGPRSVAEQIDRDRVQAITEARESAQYIRRESKLQAFQGELTSRQAALVYRDALEGFLLEVEPYRHVDDAAERFWSGRDDEVIGYVTHTPPDPDGEAWESVDQVPPNATNVDESTGATVAAEITGLGDLLDAPVTWPKTYWREIETPCGPNRIETATDYAIVSRKVLDAALRWATNFTHHIGLDLEIDADEDTLQL